MGLGPNGTLPGKNKVTGASPGGLLPDVTRDENSGGLVVIG